MLDELWTEISGEALPVEFVVTVNGRDRTGNQSRRSIIYDPTKEVLPLRLLIIFQELVNQDDHWKCDRDLFGVKRTNVQRQKSHPLYWPQTESFLANMNVAGQRGEVEESAQN